MENVPEYLKWIIGIAASMLGTLGIGKLFEMRAARRYQVEDKNLAIHQSNEVRRLDFGQHAFDKFSDRLEIVERKLDKTEDELKEVRKELSNQMERNARLEVENNHLKETNVRQEKELTQLRTDRTILSQQVNSLTNIVVGLQKTIEGMQKA